MSGSRNHAINIDSGSAIPRSSVWYGSSSPIISSSPPAVRSAASVAARSSARKVCQRPLCATGLVRSVEEKIRVSPPACSAQPLRCRLTTQTECRLVELPRILQVGDRNHRSTFRSRTLISSLSIVCRALPKPTPPTLRCPTLVAATYWFMKGRAWRGGPETDPGANGRQVPSEPSRWYKCACLAR